jgi:putative SOS response-associated peptidase YedK
LWSNGADRGAGRTASASSSRRDWGMPGPPQFGGQRVTNIRDVKSPHRRRWLGPASRCIVPATPYCEYADTKPRKTPKWFALDANRPLFAVAGLRTL